MKNIVISFHFHPGLESEIKLMCEEKNAFFFGSVSYKSISSRISFISLLRNKNNIIFYNTSIWNILFLLLKFIFGFRVIYCFHEPVLPLSIKNSFVDILKSMIVNFIHYMFFIASEDLVVFSDCGRGKIPSRWWSKVKIRKLPFDYKPILPFRLKIQKKVERRALTILFYGNVNSGKDPFEFISLFSICNVDKLKLRLIATTEYDFNRWKKFSSEKICIEFFDCLSDIEILNILSDSDIVLLPHKRCTQSAILERSTFLGLPIIFGSCNCFEEHIGVYGIRYSANQVEFLSSLLHLIDDYEIFRENCLRRHNSFLSG
jgi:hypothetical protein